MSDMLAFLQTRRSVVVKNLVAPGPDETQLETILAIATRVPDHKALAPWRFLIFAGEERQNFGEVLATAYAESNPESSAEILETERGRFARAPIVIAAVLSPVENPKVPEWEQVLSLGAACQNLCIAAQSLGFATQWITEWPAYDAKVAAGAGLTEGERFAGFIYIGTAAEAPKERARPQLGDVVSHWRAS